LPIQVGAKMTQMENRIVLTRFKDGYGPVGAYFLHLKTYTQNGYGEEYESKWYNHTKELVGDYIDRHPVPTCLRNHAFLEETKAGRGPIRMVTKELSRIRTRRTVGWGRTSSGMTIGQAVVWASQNIDPKYINPELTTSGALTSMGSHATVLPAHWGERSEGLTRPPEYQWGGGYNRMMTVGRAFRRRRHHWRHRAYKFSRGLHRKDASARRRLPVRYCDELEKRSDPQSAKQEYATSEGRSTSHLRSSRVGPQRGSSPARSRRAICCRSTACSGSRRSWTNTSAASAPTT
jgi:hypothetical protein